MYRKVHGDNKRCGDEKLQCVTETSADTYCTRYLLQIHFINNRQIDTVASWQGEGNCPLPPKFWAVGKFSSKNAKFGAENPILRMFKAEIEILNIHFFSVGNVQVSV